MGHHPQNHRSCSHCIDKNILPYFLHRLIRIITLIIIHYSAVPQGVSLSFEDCYLEYIPTP